MTAKTSAKPRVTRDAHLEWVPISLMRVTPEAQRDLNPAWVATLAKNFDLEKMGTPSVNRRDDGLFYLMDGQHTVEALKEIGYADQQMQCWVSRGLTPQQEADVFLDLNERLTVNAFTKFRVGVTAGRAEEVAIDAIVRHAGLHVQQGGAAGNISAVATLRKLFRISPALLTRTLCVVRDAYGDPGMESVVLLGIGLLLNRYGPELTDDRAISALSRASARLGGLMNRAEILRQTTHAPKSQCVAASAVELINQARNGKRLPQWWQSEPNGSRPPAE